MAKPRLILLGKLPPPYIGPAIATQVLLRSDFARTFDIHHFDTTLNTDVQSMGRFAWNKLRRSFASARLLQKQAQDLGADVALVPISQTTIGFVKDSLYIRSLRRAGVPVVVQLRGSDFKRWYRSAHFATRKYVENTLGKTEGVIVLGECLRSLFADFYAPEQIFVSPNGADYPELHGKARQPQKPLKLLYLSNFLHGKGFDVILNALAKNPALPRAMELHAYGAWDDSGFQNHCMALIERNGLENVHLHPPVSGAEKWRALNDADLFVFTPRHPEGHPWAIVEAMAAALPVISTDRGAIKESVKDGENGYIVPAEDPDALADKLTVFCNHPASITTMGEKSRTHYLAHFTAEKMGQRYTAIFQNVLARCAE